MQTLFIVATPIGNLADISPRAITVLSNVDLILAEDTRVTRTLLEHYNIKKELLSYHQHSGRGVIGKIINFLENGKNIALVSDAGTPGINDPGNFLIQEVINNLPETKIVPIPGANAAISALSISGFPTDKFTFLGFPPHKKGRQTFFRNIEDITHTVVLYESKHRIIKALENLRQLADGRPLVVCREITKQFETTYRGTAEEILMKLTANNLLGEFVVVVGPKPKKQKTEDEE
ncbi:MAG: 16S rRNA (cytidine(1402)-2'-O)-methyltransferase [Candidatus Yanofskybacteria bacterium RIFCSPHIGHO2_01_FULL_41_21]|uniref:Ribosomal RNA small subunit methyltransferase I n=2 Tax=Candidatus Yanofskyibacteriota TaxID=1752733 RepID=A0A1F8EAL2_9BACT|nr:MAG: 16S rRNA (cytidine(1402)-2'-O)-methyltransferase [Candidatus Yanofskybacteria bacterium RIFCSPHIGHO2_01_FULL_41_21]